MYWAKSYYHNDKDFRATAAHKTLDGGLIIVGGVDSFLYNNYGCRWYLPNQFVILKVNSSGIIQWQRVWPDPGFWLFYPSCHLQTDDGGFIVAGTRIIDGVGKVENHLVKYSDNGILEWQRSLHYINQITEVVAMVKSIENNVILLGSNQEKSIGGNTIDDVWLMKVNAVNGIIIWQVNISFGSTAFPKTIIQNPKGGYIVVGKIYPSSSIKYKKESFFILNISEDGFIIDKKFLYFDNASASIGSIVYNKNDDYVLTGTINKGDGASIFSVNFPLSNNKTYNWAYIYDVFISDNKKAAFAYSICHTIDKEYVIAGSVFTDQLFVQGFFGGNGPVDMQNGLLIKLKNNGIVNWSQRYGGNDIDRFFSVESFYNKKKEKGIFLGGYCESFPPMPSTNSGERIWAMKLDLLGKTSSPMYCMLKECTVLSSKLIPKGTRWEPLTKKIKIQMKKNKLSDRAINLNEYFLCP